MDYESVMKLALERGFYFPSCEVYADAQAGFWEYGPTGVGLKNKFLQLWRRELIRRDGMLEIDGSQIMSKSVFEASGHLGNFADPIIKCIKCNSTFRADRTIADITKIEIPESADLEEFDNAISQNNIKCPKCKVRFEIENLSQWGWPHDDEPHEGKIYGDPTKIRVKPEIPFRFLNFVIKKNERFQSNHYELIKVIPITATILGIAWFFGMLYLVIVLSLVAIALRIFVWDNILFKPIREFYSDMLDEAFDIKEGYAGVMRFPNTLLKKAAIAFTFLLTCLLALVILPGGILQNSDNPWIRALGELIWDIIIFILELLFYW